MNIHLLVDTSSAVRLAVALVCSGSVLLVQARLLFGPFPDGRE